MDLKKGGYFNCQRGKGITSKDVKVKMQKGEVLGVGKGQLVEVESTQDIGRR